VEETRVNRKEKRRNKIREITILLNSIAMAQQYIEEEHSLSPTISESLIIICEKLKKINGDT